MRMTDIAARGRKLLRGSTRNRFHQLPYEERVRTIKLCFSHNKNKADFDRYFANRRGTRSERSPFFDLLLAYAQNLAAQTVHQVGCFTATEARWLIDSGFDGQVIASDFDADRLAYLREQFSGTSYSGIDLRVMDLEERAYRNLQGHPVISAYAVFSNIQPETLEYFFSRLSTLETKVVLIRDIVTKDSLRMEATKAQSLPSSIDNNWYHPYLALAAKHNLEGFLLPEFQPSSEAHASCCFVIHNRIPDDVHVKSVGDAFAGYRNRQNEILSALALATR